MRIYEKIIILEKFYGVTEFYEKVLIYDIYRLIFHKLYHVRTFFTYFHAQRSLKCENTMSFS